MKKFAMITLVVIMIAALLVPATFATVVEATETYSSPHKATEGSHPADNSFPDESSNSADNVLDHTGEDAILAALAGNKVYGISFSPNPIVQGQPAVFKSEAAYADYVGTLIDNAPVPVAVAEGSTVVTLSAETTAALSVGTHTIVIESKDGAATASFEVVAGAAAEGAAAGVEAAAGTTGSAQAGEAAGAEQAAAAAAGEAAAAAAAAGAAASAASTPKTGDSSNTAMWAAISLVTLGAIGVVALPLVKKVKA